MGGHTVYIGWARISQLYPMLIKVYTRSPMDENNDHELFKVLHGICPSAHIYMWWGQQPMQYCSSFEGFLSLNKLFFYYLVGPTVIAPGLDWMW